MKSLQCNIIDQFILEKSHSATYAQVVQNYSRPLDKLAGTKQIILPLPLILKISNIAPQQSCKSQGIEILPFGSISQGGGPQK